MSRFEKLLQSLEKLQLDGFLVTHPPNLRYLFGFSGSTAAAVIFSGDARLLVDSRYTEQAEAESHDCSVEQVQRTAGRDLGEWLTQRNIRGRIGFESTALSFDTANALLSSADAMDWQPLPNVVEQLRSVKETSEVSAIQESCRIAQQAFDQFAESIDREAPESELQAAAALEYNCRSLGANRMAFETIFLSGPRTSLPHGLPGSRRPLEDEPLLVDFGVTLNGYCSDLTRMLNLDQKEVYETAQIVEEARVAAMELIRPGVESRQVDQAARQVISDYGYGEYFGHGTGHGIGLEIHEEPHISHASQQLLEEGMVFTVEPGIYLPGRFGIRLEDIVVVTKSGCHLLSRPLRLE